MLSIQLLLKEKWNAISRVIRAKKAVPLVLDYLEMGLSLESLDLGVDFSVFVETIYPKAYRRLADYLSAFEILDWMHAYEKFKSLFIKTLYQETVYALVLLFVSYLLSWFFVLRFCPSIASMLTSFNVSVMALNRYQTLVYSALFIIHMLMIVLLIFSVFFRTRDMRIIAYLRLHRKFGFLRDFMSYRFALNFNLFLRYGIKTQTMLKIMRTASVDSFSRWLAYHVEDDLVKGNNLSDAMDQSYFDSRLILIIKQGIARSDLDDRLELYIGRTQVRLIAYLKRYARILKFLVFLYLIVLMALFYSVLYLPMQVMEVL